MKQMDVVLWENWQPEFLSVTSDKPLLFPIYKIKSHQRIAEASPTFQGLCSLISLPQRIKEKTASIVH